MSKEQQHKVAYDSKATCEGGLESKRRSLEVVNMEDFQVNTEYLLCTTPEDIELVNCEAIHLDADRVPKIIILRDPVQQRLYYITDELPAKFHVRQLPTGEVLAATSTLLTMLAAERGIAYAPSIEQCALLALDVYFKLPR